MQSGVFQNKNKCGTSSQFLVNGRRANEIEIRHRTFFAAC